MFQRFSAARRIRTDKPTQLNDPSLLKTQTYVNGEWIDAKSGKTFEVFGAALPHHDYDFVHV